MYYKQLNLPSLGENLKNSLISDFEKKIKNEKPFVQYDQIFETKNINSLAYIKNFNEFDNNLDGPSASIKFYNLDYLLHNQLKKIFIKTKLAGCGFCYQLVTGGNYMAPHIDPPKHRIESVSYVLYPGDTNAKTTWYKPKKEFEHLEVSHSVCIPFTKLEAINEYIAESDKWYWYDVSTPHSVTNLTGNRMFLQAYGNFNFKNGE